MGVTAECLKEMKDNDDVEELAEAYNSRVYKQFGMLVRVKAKTNYVQNLNRNEDMHSGNFQFFCSKVLDHSYQIENEILLSKLAKYTTMNQPKKPRVKKIRKQKTESEEDEAEGAIDLTFI